MKKEAFTITELVIVVTVFAILGALVFQTYTKYTIQSRDTKRIQDISTIDKSLELSRIDNSIYPVPSDYNDINYSGTTVWKQGTFGDSIIKYTSRIIEKPLDALFENDYTYSVTQSQKEYEIGWILEQPLSSDTTWYQALVKGSYNGKILISWQNYVLALPSIITADLWDLDAEDIVTNKNIVYDQYSNIPSSYKSYVWEWSMTGSFNYLPGDLLLLSGSMSELSTSTWKINFMKSLQTAYSGTTLSGSQNFSILLSTQSDQWLLELFQSEFWHLFPF